jgi:hypothetical protein
VTPPLRLSPERDRELRAWASDPAQHEDIRNALRDLLTELDLTRADRAAGLHALEKCTDELVHLKILLAEARVGVGAIVP